MRGVWEGVAIAVLGLVGTALAGEGNRLENGGFEKRLAGWTVLAPTGMRHELDRRRRKEGKRSLHLAKVGGFGGDSVRARVGGIAPGQEVVVKAWFAGDGVENAWFKVLFFDAGGKTLGQGDHVERLHGTYDWREVVLKNEAPAGTAAVEVFVLMALGGELWIDDVRLTAAAPAAPAPLEPLDEKTGAFLDRHAIKVATLDFAAPLTDLRALAKRLEGVRIVQLGENSHGDGACFRAKARLVRYLHEACGFDVLAFESGLFECERANALLRAGRPDEAMRASLFGIWRVEQVRPLFAYLAESTRGRRPMRLTGFDTRGSGDLAKSFLAELQEFLAPVGALGDDERDALEAIDAQLAGEYRPEPDAREAGRAALASLRAIFERGRKQLVARHGARDVAFWSWCLDNYADRETFEHSKLERDEGAHKSVNLRDARMAKNFRWLAEKRYPGAKIITWAATFHQARRLRRVSIGGDDDYYAGTKGMGEFVHEWYGPRVFTIGFCAAEGRAGIFRARFTIPPPKPGSVEDLLRRYGEPYLLVPLRPPGPFAGTLNAAPLAYGRDTKGPWPEVLDAFFFIREMTPTRAMGR